MPAELKLVTTIHLALLVARGLSAAGGSLRRTPRSGAAGSSEGRHEPPRQGSLDVEASTSETPGSSGSRDGRDYLLPREGGDAEEGDGEGDEEGDGEDDEDDDELTNAERIDKRIVRGLDTDITVLPYQVALENPHYLCSGSIISSDWVLTAAHCLPGKPVTELAELQVRAGSALLETAGSVHRVVGGERHPGYKDDKVDWDVAVLRVSPAFILDDTRTPVRLANADDQLWTGTRVLVSGWGYKEQTAKEAARVLQRTTLTVVPHALCRLLYARLAHISERMVCAGSLVGRDACSGDSGGPMVLAAGPASPDSPASPFTQYGIVSFGKGCSHVRHPGVFTNVADKDIREYIRLVSGI